MQQPSEYKVSLNNMRYTSHLLINCGGAFISVYGVIDTGARFTCIPENAFDRRIDIRYTGRDHIISGSVKSATYSIREIFCDSVEINGLHLDTPQCVYVTSDSQVQDIVIGMDVLSQLDFAQLSAKSCLYLRQGMPAQDGTVITAHVTNYTLCHAVCLYLQSRDIFSSDVVLKCLKCLPRTVDMSYTDLSALLRQIVDC